MSYFCIYSEVRVHIINPGGEVFINLPCDAYCSGVAGQGDVTLVPCAD